jgi:hypothetical protein
MPSEEHCFFFQMKECTFNMIALSHLSVEHDFRLPHIKTLFNAFFPEVCEDINRPDLFDTFTNTSGLYIQCVDLCKNQLCA